MFYLATELMRNDMIITGKLLLQHRETLFWSLKSSSVTIAISLSRSTNELLKSASRMFPDTEI